MHNCQTCGCNSHSTCNCNTPIIARPVGQISGELLGSNQIALIQNGAVIGTIPVVSSGGTTDILDAFGDVIPN